jgi:FLVCR family MFS transporter 7
MGATLLFAGIIAAAISSPVFDRVFTRHLGLTIKILVPILSALWLSLIWASAHSESLFPVFVPDRPPIQFVQTMPPHCLCCLG